MKRIAFIAIVLVISLFSVESIAQIRLDNPPGSGIGWAWDETAALADREIVLNPPATFFRLAESKEISTQPLKTIYPDEAIPDERFTVKIPAEVEAGEPHVLLLHLQLADDPSFSIINAVIVTNYGTNATRYYIDANNNRDYTDDGSPIRFSNNQQYTVVTIAVKNSNGFRQRYKYQLPNLNQNEALKEQFMTDEAKALKEAEELELIESLKLMPLNAKSRVNLLFGVSVGSGNAELDFDYANEPDGVETRNFSTQFSSTIQLTLGASYTFLRNFNIGGVVVFENNHSTQQTQRIDRRINDNLDQSFLTNSGFWPENSIHLGGFLEYNIRLRPNLYFAPTVQYATYRLSNSKSFIPTQGSGIVTSTETPYSESFINRNKLSYGGKFKFNISNKSVLFIEGRYTTTNFDVAEGYLDSNVVSESVNLDFTQVTISVGAELLLTSKY